MKKSRLIVAVTCGLVMTASMFVTHQNCSAQTLETRAYPIKDIVAGFNNYSFQGITLPKRADERFGSQSRTGGGFGGGGGVPSGAGGGGGVFSVQDELMKQITFRTTGGGGFNGMDGFAGTSNETSTLTVDDIQSMLFELVRMQDPSFEEDGNMSQLGTTLIVTASKANHDVIAQSLKLLRQTVSETSRSVTVKVTWLRLDNEMFRSLEVTPENGVLVVDRAQLNSLIGEHGASGSITCFDGQTVHLVSGDLRNTIPSMSPVVGALDNPETQHITNVASAKKQSTIQLVSSPGKPTSAEPSQLMQSNNQIGYSPKSEMVNEGAMLQLTPVIVPGTNQVLLDIHSNVVIPYNGSPESIQFTENISLDRMHVKSQQFMTSLRMPIDTPVIAGGSTIQIGVSEAIYVIIEIHAGE